MRTRSPKHRSTRLQTLRPPRQQLILGLAFNELHHLQLAAMFRGPERVEGHIRGLSARRYAVLVPFQDAFILPGSSGGEVLELGSEDHEEVADYGVDLFVSFCELLSLCICEYKDEAVNK